MSDSPRRRIALFIGRSYVPVVSVLLALLVGNWLAKSYAVDPLMAAQNQRIRFQQGGELLPAGSLSAEEARLAEAVLDKDGTGDKQRTGLLYIGNSQSLAIMDQQPGDIITPQWLQILLARQTDLAARSIHVQLGSLPNITATESLIKLIAAGGQSPRQIDMLLAATVLEEFRGLGVRDEVAAALESSTAKADLVSLVQSNPDLTLARKALEPFINPESKHPTAADNAASKDSVAETVEQRLQAAAEKMPLFAERQNLQMAVDLTYNAWRDRLLGITSSTARPVPDSSYRATLELIELALRYARSKNIEAVFYLAPMRLGVQPNPNLPSDVARFRRDVPALCNRYGVTCLDYVDLIPENLWTNYPDEGAIAGQRDFAHFTGAAHKKLAEQLIADLDPQLTRYAQAKKDSEP